MKITYEDKVKLQDEPDIPNKNKVTDNDMNEIKDVVNTNADELDTAKENIENLEEGQDVNNTDIANLKSKVTTLETDNAKNKSDISNLQKDNETNKTNISNLRNSKVDKIEGKGLSTEDFTTQLKTKLEGLENYNDAEIKGKIQTLEDDNATNKNNISTLQNKVETLETDNTTNKSNITNLQEDVEDLGKGIEENTADISNLQAENKNLKEEVESYKNSLPRETLKGEYITMQNTADKVKFKDFVLGGNSKQESRSGKNILDINSPELYEKDALAEIEGNKLSASCANVTRNSYISIPLELKPNTDYTFSAIAKVTENTTPEGTKNSYIKIRSEKTGGDWISAGVQAAIDLKSTGEQSIGLSFNSGEYSKGWLWIYLMDTTAEGNIGIDFTNLQVEEGSTATDYEEYGATPSPEIPSKIENVEGNVEITVANKNIANAEQLYQDMLNFNPNVKKEVVDGRNCLVFSNMLFMSNKGFKGLQGIYKENTRYVVRAKCRVQNTSITSGMSLLIEACDKEGNKIGYHNNGANGANWIQFSFLTNADASVDYIAFSYGNNTMWCLDMDSLEIYEAESVEDYVENKQQQVVFPLAQNQKLMLGDYLDDDGIHHKRKQIVLDGTESNWVLNGNFNDIATQITLRGLTGIKAIHLCTHFINGQVANGMWLGGSLNFLPALETGLTTLESWKAYLAQQKQAGTPVILEYEPATEEIEPYTEEQQEADNKLKELTTYAGQTNIYSTNNIKPVFTVTGIKDVNALITQVNQLILEGGN